MRMLRYLDWLERQLTPIGWQILLYIVFGGVLLLVGR